MANPIVTEPRRPNILPVKRPDIRNPGYSMPRSIATPNIPDPMHPRFRR